MGLEDVALLHSTQDIQEFVVLLAGLGEALLLLVLLVLFIDSVDSGS